MNALDRVFAAAPRADAGAVRDDIRGRHRGVPPAQHRGLSGSDAADGRRGDAEPRALGRGDRALHHHPDRDADRGGAQSDVDQDDLALWPVGREAAIHASTTPTTRPCSRSSIDCRSLPPLPNNVQPQISPVSPIGEIYRYKLVGPPGYSVLDLKTLQDWVLQRRFPRGAGRHRRDRLGRQDQDLRAAGRFQQVDGLRPDAAAGPADAQQQQHQCRRQHAQYRQPVGGRARRRPDPLAGRSQQHDADAGRRQPRAGEGRRQGHRGTPAAPRHCRQGRGRRHRSGHRPDAPWRAEHADHQARRAGSRAHQQQAAFCRPACGSSASTIARSSSTSRPGRSCTTWCSASG